MHVLESSNILHDVLMIDAFFHLYTVRESSSTYGKLSKAILSRIVKFPAREIHLIFDQDFSTSIKDYACNKRSAPSDRQYKITESMKFSSCFSVELKNVNFKRALVHFLIEHWQTEEMIPFLQNKTVLINYDECHEYRVRD